MLGLPRPFLIVGRIPPADLVLDHEQVSRRHAYLQVVAGRVFCVDLMSRTGTFREGTPLRSGWLDRRQALRIGPYTLRLRGGDRAEGGWPAGCPGTPPPPSIVAAGPSPLPAIALEIACGGGCRGDHPADRPRAAPDRARVHMPSPPPAPRGLAPPLRLGADTRGGLAGGPALAPGRDAQRVERALLPAGRGGRSAPRPLRAPPAPRSGGGTVRRSGPGAIGGGTAPSRVRGHDTPSARTGGALNPAALPARTAPRVVGTAPRERPAVPAPQPTMGQAMQLYYDVRGDIKEIIISIAQMFGVIQRDHMDLIREELEQIRRLTEEMHALRAESGVPRSAPPAAASDGRSGATSRAESPLEDIASPAGRPVQPEHGAPPVEHLASPPTDCSVPGRVAGGGRAAPTQRRIRRDPKEIEALVGERLATYERERQGPWNKIVRLMTGH